MLLSLLPARAGERTSERDAGPAGSGTPQANARQDAILEAAAERRRITANDVEVLLRKWHALRYNGSRLPPFEDLAIGSLGRSSDNCGILRRNADGSVDILRAGDRFVAIASLIDAELLLSGVPEGLRLAIDATLEEAVVEGAPARSAHKALVDGIIATVEVHALPLAARWPGDYFLVFLRTAERHTVLADLLIDSSHDGLLALSPLRKAGAVVDFHILGSNRSAERFLGTPTAVLNISRLSRILELRGCASQLSLFCQACDPSAEERTFELVSAVGESRFSLQVSAVEHDDMLSVTLTDVGEIKSREALFTSLFRDNPVPMVVRAADGRTIRRVNAAALHLFGRDETSFLRSGLTALDRKVVEEVRLAADSGNGKPVEIVGSHSDAEGRELHTLEYAREIIVDGRRAILSTIVDLTARKQAEERALFLAHHDPLTKLANRTLFSAELDRAFQRLDLDRTPFAVLCVDLDEFKLVNDTLGHAAGDALLVEVAKRLKQNVRGGDFLARLGGDEFAVLLPKARGPETVEAVASRVMAALSQPMEFEGKPLQIGASAGFALAPLDADGPEKLLKCADLALYRAKDVAGNAVVRFDTEMDSLFEKRRLLEAELRQALTRQEFELHFQPIVAVETARLQGFEVLLRWRSPGRGLVSPAEFIPVSEETGLIVPIGEWVIREACRQAAGWPEELIVAVNVSAVQFRQGDLTEVVARALRETGIAPSRLEIEITESVILEDSDSNMCQLEGLRAMGVRIALDDFGTGYASMSYLKKFTFSRIKIDRSFVQEVNTSPASLAIVRAIVGLGNSLGIVTTAEGVETTEQLEVLRAERCADLQGYLFSPPLPASQTRALIHSFAGAPKDRPADEAVA